jgi:succinoglycan biosynthesis transport protein ExoP
MDLFDALQIVWRRKAMILAVLFLSCGGAFVASKLLPKAYEGRVTLIFPHSENGGGTLASLLSSAGLHGGGNLPGLGGLLGDSQASAEVVDAMLRSRTLATRVAIACDLKRVYKTASLEKTVRRLQDATSIRNDRTAAMQVAVRAPTPVLAATLANRTVSELKRMSDEKVDLFLARKNRRFIERQLARTQRDLARAEERLKRFEETHAIVSLKDEVRTAIESMAEIEKERTLGRVEGADVDAQLAEVRRQVQAQTSHPVEDLPAHSTVIRDLREKLVDLNTQLAVANEEFTPEHPTVRQLQAEVDETRRQIEAEARRVRRSLDTGLAPELVKLEVEKIAGEARTTALDRAINGYRGQFDRLPEEGLQLARLTRDREVQEGIYTLLTSEHERARLMEAREGPSFVVLDPAVVPERPVFPRTLINVIVAGVLGLWLGVTCAFLAERAKADVGHGSKNGTGPAPHGATPFPEERVAQVVDPVAH